MEMKINGTDARTLGIRMGDGFLNALTAPAPMKEFIENTSRLEHGKRVLYDKPRLADREVTLTFTLFGNTEVDFMQKLKSFEAILYVGFVELYVEATKQTYRLTYERSQTYAQNQNRTACNITVKFNEPNPANRGE
ncbi:hypothetical protein [Bacteroides sp. 51]|uniref:hypothetical protein n=1 Tax=Bacteroides sp. 51 TaxID=2302938 RepID=UPI0013D0EC26|nr:hypothetical protein [Bacteroides sp. 51]NDV83643.1 hypothetical protein [Bacteroides sp. 51]